MVPELNMVLHAKLYHKAAVAVLLDRSTFNFCAYAKQLILRLQITCRPYSRILRKVWPSLWLSYLLVVMWHTSANWWE